MTKLHGLTKNIIVKNFLNMNMNLEVLIYFNENRFATIEQAK